VDPGQTVAANIKPTSLTWKEDVKSGFWSSAENWVGNFTPTPSNVYEVIIPAGASVVYDDSVINMTLDDLKSSGNFQITGGNLNIKNDFNTNQYTQSGGEVTITNNFIANDYTQSGGNLSADNFKVDNAFTQTGGAITANKDATIHTINDLEQATSGSIKAVNLDARSEFGDVTLAGLNLITGVLNISADSDIYSRTKGVSQIASLNAPNGEIDVENSGGFTLGFDPNQTAANAGSEISITAKSPLTINGVVSSTNGSINLKASNGDTLDVNAPLSALKGDVVLDGGTLTINSPINTPNSISLKGNTIAGRKAGSYAQYLNNSTLGENTLNDPIEETTAGVLGTISTVTPSIQDKELSTGSSINNNETDTKFTKPKDLKTCSK
jgi:hypothetical protein